MNETLAIAFSLSKAWSYKAKKDAIDQAGSFANLVQNSGKKFESLDLKSAQAQIKKIEKHHAWIWIYGDPGYPVALSRIPNPPLVIYGLGRQDIHEENLLAVVGTRNPTPYGKRVGLWLAKDLVREGITLVSGLARGIDSLAHKASVDLEADTIAVLAHGLDMIFPPENKRLKEEIIKNGGTIISEYPFGIKPLAGYFPQRNRIISGLCKATLVVEAGEKSGTRHTVNHALEQSREVLAVPGAIDSEYSLYPNELIFNGAHMVRTSEDILAFYSSRTKRKTIEEKKEFKPNKLQRQLLGFLSKDEPKSIEEFLSITTFKPKDAIQSLTELELYGRVVKQLNSTYLLAQ